MRKLFFELMNTYMEKNKNLIFLTADLGFPHFESLKSKYQERVINVGVAEQSMIGIATGMAKLGFIPICYSITNFSLFRPYEFIRNGPVFHNLPVKIVGMGAGIDYSYDGWTHNSLEDLNIALSLPNFEILSPHNEDSMNNYFEEFILSSNPGYLRLNRSFELFPIEEKDENPGTTCLVVNIGANRYRFAEIEKLLGKLGIVHCLFQFDLINDKEIEKVVQKVNSYKFTILLHDNFDHSILENLISPKNYNIKSDAQIISDGFRKRIIHETGDSYLLEKKYRKDISELETRILKMVN
jgi:deoxyxylulose-5-phosphate synthase